MPMMTAHAEGIALRTARLEDRVALRGVRLRSRLVGMTQKTTLEQTFVNLESQAIEAVYTFPLPENAAVHAFEVVTGDRVLTGQIETQDDAIEKYESAIERGDAAYLLEQQRPDVFTVRVGNIRPRQAATIRLTYLAPLDRVDKQIRVAFPTTVAPRYVTASGTDPLEAMVEGDAVNPPHVLHVPYGLQMEVDIDLGRRIRNVFSPSHPIDVRPSGEDELRVTLSGTVTEMNRDIVLTIDLPSETEPQVQWAPGPDGAKFLAVTFVPEFETSELVEPQPSEVVFVLDCSGSMQGESIQQATAALELCLRSLSAGDRFNICRFGSTFELMASEPLVYSQQTLDRAIAYIRRGADLGGTELFSPLVAILGGKPEVGAVRQIILLTDGQVSNEQAVIELARKSRSHNRIFSFGIGASSSAFLVKGVARATGGASEFITAGERIDEKVLRTFGRLASPVCTDLSLDWDGKDVQTLAEIPPVFDGDVLTVFGRAPGALPGEVKLSCQTPRGGKSWSVALPASQTKDDGAIALMWARRTIQSLEEVNPPQRVKKSAEPTRERETLIQISKQFGLLCSLTSFVAIEHRTVEERNAGQPALRRVPVQLAQGWGGMMAAGGAPVAMAAMAAAPAPMTFGRNVPQRCHIPASPKRKSFFSRLRRGGDDVAPDALMAAPIAPQAAMDQESARDLSVGDLEEQRRDADPLTALLMRQSADGSFAADTVPDELVRAAGRDPASLRQSIESKLPADLKGKPRQQALLTLLSLWVLSHRFADRSALWTRAFAKACRDFLAPLLRCSADDVKKLVESL